MVGLFLLANPTWMCLAPFFRLHASTLRVMGSGPHRGTKIPQVHGVAKKKKAMTYH